MNTEAATTTTHELPIGDGAAALSGNADAGSEAAATKPATDPAAEPAPKARVFQDDVRKAIVQRHREHRQAAPDASLSAARGESTRVAQAGEQSNGEAGDAATAGGTVGMGGRDGSPASPPDDTRTVRVKVYGNEYSVPASVVEEAGGVENFQKTAAADVMLRRANEAAKRAERAAQDLEARAQQATIPATAGASRENPGLPSGDTGDASTALKDESRELLDAMLDSNPDRVAKVLGKVVSKVAEASARSAPNRSSSPADAAAPATRSAPAGRVERTDTEIATANAVFDTEFRGIRQNPEAMKIARDLVRSRMADPRFDGTPLPELAREIGKQLASTIRPASSAGGTPNANVDATLQLREAVKRQMPTTRTGQSLSGNPAPAKPEPSRGQKQQSYVAMLRARSGSNATIAERRASTQR